MNKNELGLEAGGAEGTDRERRNLALAVLGAVGGATLLGGCAVEPSASGSAVVDRIYEGVVGTSAVRWVDTVADLKSVTGQGVGADRVSAVVVLGRNARGDGGGGLFKWI